MIITLLSICIAIVLIHFGYYIVVFNFFNIHKTKINNNNKTPVSVIVCAKNEQENLKKYLPHLINQNYPEFELILINDRSYDDTGDIFEEYEAKYGFVKVVTVKESEHFYGNKKYALTLGIKAATHDCLLFTDADCLPKSKLWIQEMANHFDKKNKIVLGYGAHETIRNSLLNKLIRFETLITAIQYFSFAKIGQPYMGVGRNLMYDRKLFFKNKGFNQHINVMSGDDDLLINQIANKKNTTICIAKNGHTLSPPKTSISSWINQKRRHISTAHLYKPFHQFFLGLYALNRVLFWIVFPFSYLYISNPTYKIVILGLIALKIISEYIVIAVAAKKLQEKGLLLLIPLLEILLLFFQLYIFACNKVNKPNRWA